MIESSGDGDIEMTGVEAAGGGVDVLDELEGKIDGALKPLPALPVMQVWYSLLAHDGILCDVKTDLLPSQLQYHTKTALFNNIQWHNAKVIGSLSGHCETCGRTYPRRNCVKLLD